MPWKSSSRAALCAALVALSIGCAHTGGAPKTEDRTIVRIDRTEVPPSAQFVALGSIDVAYQVTGVDSSEARLPVPEGAVDGLLPGSIRLFRFAGGGQGWIELDDSSYDTQTRELVASDLAPGLYTAFGWSANPVDNALQRLAADASLGYGALSSEQGYTPGPDGGDEPDLFPRFRQELLRAWLVESFTYGITSCQTTDAAGCPQECRRAAGRIILRSCRVNGVECPQPECCDCVTGRFTERLYIPLGIFDVLPIRCPTSPLGLPCPACPTGLSCPTGPYADEAAIRPNPEDPDFGFFESIGLGVAVDDPVLGPSLRELIEATTGAGRTP